MPIQLREENIMGLHPNPELPAKFQCIQAVDVAATRGFFIDNRRGCPTPSFWREKAIDLVKALVAKSKGCMVTGTFVVEACTITVIVDHGRSDSHTYTKDDLTNTPTLELKADFEFRSMVPICRDIPFWITASTPSAPSPSKYESILRAMSSRPPLRGERKTYFVMDEFGKYVPNPIDNLYRKHKEQAVSQKLDEMIAVMQAAKDGKKIETRPLGETMPWMSVAVDRINWNWSFSDYRVAPEPSYRPYTDEEMVNMVGKKLRNNIGLVALVTDSAREFGGIGFATQIVIQLGTKETSWFDAERLLKDMKHLDGTPCGVLVTPD